VHVHVQKLVSVIKIATMLEECTIEEQRSVVRFFASLWAKVLNAKDIRKKVFPVYDRKLSSRKAVHTLVA
jgi:hypothetical protein